MDKFSSIVTPEKYFNMLEQKDKITSEDAILAQNLEKYIRFCHKYKANLVEDVLAVYEDFMQRLKSLSAKEEKTPMEEMTLQMFQDILHPLAEETELEQTELPSQEEGMKLSLDRTLPSVAKSNNSGYINATVILVMILNIGFIVAMAIIGR